MTQLLVELYAMCKCKSECLLEYNSGSSVCSTHTRGVKLNQWPSQCSLHLSSCVTTTSSTAFATLLLMQPAVWLCRSECRLVFLSSGKPPHDSHQCANQIFMWFWTWNSTALLSKRTLQPIPHNADSTHSFIISLQPIINGINLEWQTATKRNIIRAPWSLKTLSYSTKSIGQIPKPFPPS